jgi:hypothetical protein
MFLPVIIIIEPSIGGDTQVAPTRSSVRSLRLNGCGTHRNIECRDSLHWVVAEIILYPRRTACGIECRDSLHIHSRWEWILRSRCGRARIEQHSTGVLH